MDLFKHELYISSNGYSRLIFNTLTGVCKQFGTECRPLKPHVALADSRSALGPLHDHSLQGDFIWKRRQVVNGG